MKEHDFKLSIPISTPFNLLDKIGSYIDNPYPLKVVSKLPKKKCSIITLPRDVYFKLKELFPGKGIEAIVYSVCKTREDELFYGSLLFNPAEGWVREKVVPWVGRVDGWNPRQNLLVELKFTDGWLHALGQVLAYSLAFPGAKKEVWLLEVRTTPPKKKEKIKEVCTAYGVSVQFLDIADL